jgi:hypothetical protein
VETAEEGETCFENVALREEDMDWKEGGEPVCFTEEEYKIWINK